MIAATKVMAFFFQYKSTPTQEKRREIFSTFASNDFLISTQTLEELFDRTIPENLLLFNEEDFVFCKYDQDTWELTSSHR